MQKLNQSCRQVLERLQQRNVQQWTCILCAQCLRGQDALMGHLITTHHVHCEHFDNIADLDGMLDFLFASTRVVAPDGSVAADGAPAQDASPPSNRQATPLTAQNWRCPVCRATSAQGASTTTAITLEQHMQECAHHMWNAQTIPELGRFYVCNDTSTTAGYTDDAPCDDARLCENISDNNDEDADDAAVNSDVDDLSDWQEECPCLYCGHRSHACLQHMCDAHGFDLVDALRGRVDDDVHDDYDLIRLINVVRRSVDRHACPRCARSFHADDDDGTRTTASGSDASALEEHMRQNPTHRLPLQVSRGDDSLIPALRGDPLISFLMANSDTLFGFDHAEPNYPVVPTVLELAAARRAAMQNSQAK